MLLLHTCALLIAPAAIYFIFAGIHLSLIGMVRFFKPFTNTYIAGSLWFGLSLFAIVKQVLQHNYTTYLTYKYTFINLLSRTNLYLPQPSLFRGSNHYGPIFSLVVAPFTLLPDSAAVILWVIFNAGILYYAIQQLPIALQQRNIIVALCSVELMTSSFNAHFNPAIAALIILSFTLIKKQEDFWAALLIVLGSFIKLYGIVGIAFLFFSNHKLKFLGSLLFWGVVIFLLPMFFSTPAFLLETYYDWFSSLRDKHLFGVVPAAHDVSAITLVRYLFSNRQVKDSFVIVPAVIILSSCYIRVKAYSIVMYQLLILASVLIFTVIFSPGTESPAYIIAFTGIALWFVNLKRPASVIDISLLAAAFILTGLLPSPLMPNYLDQKYIERYVLEALPCLFIWIKIVFESLFRSFETKENIATE